MSLQEQLAEFVLQTSTNPLAQQLAPLVVVISCIVFPLAFRNSIYAFSFSVINMLDYLYNILSWSSTHSSGKDSVTSKRPRTRAEQVRERNRQAIVDADQSGKFNDGYYAGLVNISGTYCFMNSTLQAFASLQSLLPYLDEVHAQAEACDVPSPITDTLRELLRVLNNPQPYPRAIRPDAIISTLSHPEPGKRSPLFTSREHQDAQELFQLVSELVKKEANAVDLERGRDRGLGFVLDFEDEESDEAPEVVKLSQKTVFDGLTANRRSCLECGYTEAVMHFSFNSWQLPLPRTTTCRLEECLAEYTKLEVLTDCICRRCSMDATLARLEEDTERLAADSKPSNSRKKALRDARKLRARVEAALKEGRVEDDIKGLKISRVFSRASTKQAIVARPPRVLALHLNRSMTYGAYASKNSVYVVFSEILDLSPFATAGALSTRPESSISPPGSPRIPVLYRLAAVVCHYGTHQFGHYIAFRRKPPLHPPQLASMSPTGELLFEGGRTIPGKGWLRISDDSVSECGLESALAEGSGAFMLYYERVQLPQAPTDPEMAPAAMTSRASSVPRRGARILRSVSAGWSSPSDSSSVSSSSRDTSVTSAEDDEHRATPHDTLKTVASIEGCVAGDEGLSLPSDGVVLSEEP